MSLKWEIWASPAQGTRNCGAPATLNITLKGLARCTYLKMMLLIVLSFLLCFHKGQREKVGDWVPPGELAAGLLLQRKSTAIMLILLHYLMLQRCAGELGAGHPSAVAVLCKYLQKQGQEKETKDPVSLFCQTAAHQHTKKSQQALLSLPGDNASQLPEHKQIKQTLKRGL